MNSKQKRETKEILNDLGRRFYHSFTVNTKGSSAEFSLPGSVHLNESLSFTIENPNLSYWITMRNIIDNSNDKLRYRTSTTNPWKVIDFTEGSWDILDLRDEIRRVLTENGDVINNAGTITYPFTISLFKPNQRVVIDITQNGFEIDFTFPNSINTVLGFNSQIYSQGYHKGENEALITDKQAMFLVTDLISPNSLINLTDNIVKPLNYIRMIPTYARGIGKRDIIEDPNPPKYLIPKSKYNLSTETHYIRWVYEDETPVIFGNQSEWTMEFIIRSV